MKVTGEWLNAIGVQTVFKLLTDAGFQAYGVGGCVRNALLDVPVNDVDICTDAHPEKVMELAAAANLKVIPTGIDHGTVTIAIFGQGIEVTTLRQDVETDGRRAVVAFADNIETDARRRDFTINAIYVDQFGTISDPLDGLKDIPSRTIRFIDDPHERIREDALRILRFFRFYAHYGDPDNGIDQDGLAACATNIELLDNLSDERIGMETRKLLSAPDPSPALALMHACGALAQIMPGASPMLAPLIHVENAREPRWTRRMAAIGGIPVSQRLKLSKAEIKHLTEISNTLESGISTKHAAYLYCEKSAVDAALIMASMSGQMIKPEAEAAQGASLEFPIKARMLMPPLSPGPDLGKAMKRLEEIWIASDFQLTQTQLLEKL